MANNLYIFSEEAIRIVILTFATLIFFLIFEYIRFKTNKDIVKKFLGLFSHYDTFFYGKEAERPLSTIERRYEIRHECDIPAEFVLNDGADQTVKGVILNFSDSGLCINSSIPLDRGQRIIIKRSNGSIPTRHQAFTVQWASAHMAGLSAHFDN